MPRELTANQKKKKKSLFWSVIFSYSTQHNKPFLDWIVMCDEKWSLYDSWPWPAQWLDWEEVPKHFPKPYLHQKMSWSLFGGLLPVWSTTDFWILAKALPLRSLLSRLMRCTKSCNACSQNWSTERAQFFSMIMPDHALYNQWFKSWMHWAPKFCLIRHIHLLLSNQLPLLQASRQLFAGKTLSQPAEGRKMLYKSSRNPKAWIFMF